MKNGDVVCEVEMDAFTVGMEIDDKGFLARIRELLLVVLAPRRVSSLSAILAAAVLVVVVGIMGVAFRESWPSRT